MTFRFESLEFTDLFLETLASKDFSAAERASFIAALKLLDANERHPSLRVHQLKGDRAGSWCVSASRSLRITFERRGGGVKTMLTCSRHYDR